MDSMKDVEIKKRQLEESVDSLTEECAKLKAQEKASLANKPQDDFNQQLKAALESQLDSTRETHVKQVAALRNEIAEKSAIVEELKEYGNLEKWIFQFVRRSHKHCFQFPQQIATGQRSAAK